MKDARLKTGMLESVDDSGDVRRGTATWLGRTGQPIQVAGIYGLVSNPPAGSQVLLLPQNGQESASIGLADHPKLRPVRDLEEGEVALVNYLTKSHVIFKQNGDIEVFTEAGNLIAAITGNIEVTATGNVAATISGNLMATAAQINLNGVIIDGGGNITTTGIVTANDFIET
jgi:phage gp45-like